MTLPQLLIVEAAAPAADINSALDPLRALAGLAARHPFLAIGLSEIDDPGISALDPTVVAGLLAAEGAGALVVTADTSRHAPFNLARRLQTLSRITGGRVGVRLRATGVDRLTLASGGVSADYAADPPRAFGEYLEVLARLSRSFPEDALIGDRDAGILADPARLAPAQHGGDVYAVAGSLNVPLDPALRALVILDETDAAALGDAFDPAVIDAVVAGDAAGARAAAWLRAVRWDPASVPAVDLATHLGEDDTDGLTLRIDAPPAAIPDAVAALIAALGAEETDEAATPLRARLEKAVAR